MKQKTHLQNNQKIKNHNPKWRMKHRISKIKQSNNQTIEQSNIKCETIISQSKIVKCKIKQSAATPTSKQMHHQRPHFVSQTSQRPHKLSQKGAKTLQHCANSIAQLHKSRNNNQKQKL